MPKNLSITVIKKWAKNAGLEMVEALDRKRGVICMIPVEDVLIPLIIRLDSAGFIVFYIFVVRDVQNDIQLFQTALEMSLTFPAKISLCKSDLMLVMDVRVHQGFSDEDFREALVILKLIVEQCYWSLKYIARETQKRRDTPDDPSQRFSWPEWLLSPN